MENQDQKFEFEIVSVGSQIFKLNKSTGQSWILRGAGIEIRWVELGEIAKNNE